MSCRVGKGRRTGPLRKHIKNMDPIYGLIIGGIPIKLVRLDRVALYLEIRVSEPCGKSVLLSILKTLLFMEHALEVPANRQLSKQPAIKNTMEEGDPDIRECRADG